MPGSTKSDIDGLASAGYGGMHEVQLAEYLGLTPRWMESTSVGGSSFEFHAMHAYRAHPEAGDVDTVAIVYGNNQLSASGRTLGTGGGGGGRGMAMPLPMAYEFPTGPHARRRVRDGRAAAHARVRHDARTARVDRGTDP